jgi:hypothetical protein
MPGLCLEIGYGNFSSQALRKLLATMPLAA